MPGDTRDKSWSQQYGEILLEVEQDELDYGMATVGAVTGLITGSVKVVKKFILNNLQREINEINEVHEEVDEAVDLRMQMQELSGKEVLINFGNQFKESGVKAKEGDYFNGAKQVSETIVDFASTIWVTKHAS